MCDRFCDQNRFFHRCRRSGRIAVGIRLCGRYVFDSGQCRHDDTFFIQHSPAVLWVVVAVSLLLYKLDKLMPQIKTDNEERRKAIAEKTTGQQEG